MLSMFEREIELRPKSRSRRCVSSLIRYCSVSNRGDAAPKFFRGVPLHYEWLIFFKDEKFLKLQIISV